MSDRCSNCGRDQVAVHPVASLDGRLLCLTCFTKLAPAEGDPIPEPEPATAAVPRPPPAPPAKPGKRVITLRPASAYPIRKLAWLYPPYLPLGKVAILAGPPGQGKSQLSLFLAAAVTRGELPGDVRTPADVIVVSAEDDVNDTIVPRLTALGADFDHVLILNVQDRETDGSLIDAALALPSDGPALATQLNGRRPKLIILDPVSAFLDAGVDSYKNASVRRALQPLKMLAESVTATILAITHLSKGLAAGEPLDKVIDSVAFAALARSVMLMSADPDDEEGTRGSSKVMLLAKGNLSEPGEHPQRYRLESLRVPTGDGETTGTSRLVMVGAAPDISASDLMMPPDDRSEAAAAVAFLRGELSDGWRYSADLGKAAEGAGITPSALKRARGMVCDRAKKEPGSLKWMVGLRGSSPHWKQGVTPARTPGDGPLDPHRGSNGGSGASGPSPGTPVREPLGQALHALDPLNPLSAFEGWEPYDVGEPEPPAEDWRDR